MTLADSGPQAKRKVRAPVVRRLPRDLQSLTRATLSGGSSGASSDVLTDSDGPRALAVDGRINVVDCVGSQAGRSPHVIVRRRPEPDVVKTTVRLTVRSNRSSPTICCGPANDQDNVKLLLVPNGRGTQLDRRPLRRLFVRRSIRRVQRRPSPSYW